MADVYEYTYTQGTELFDGISWSNFSNIFDGDGDTFGNVQVGKYGSTEQASTTFTCDSLDAPIDSTSFGPGTPIIDKVQVRGHYYNEYIGLTDQNAKPIINRLAGPQGVSTLEYGGSSSTDWTNDGLQSGGYATCSISSESYSKFLRLSNFGFDIPADAVIKGIKVDISTYSLWGNYEISGQFIFVPFIYTYDIRLVNGLGTVVGNNQVNLDVEPEPWGFFSAEGVGDTQSYTYGGPTNKWGTSLTASDINNSNFGFVISALNFNTQVEQALIDSVKVTIYYEAEPTDNIIAPDEMQLYFEASYNNGSSFPGSRDLDLFDFGQATPDSTGYFDIDITNLTGAPTEWTVDDLNSVVGSFKIYKGPQNYTIWKTYISKIELVVAIRFNYGFVVYDENGDEVMNTEDGITRVFYDGYSPPANIDVGLASDYTIRTYTYPTSPYSGQALMDFNLNTSTNTITISKTASTNLLEEVSLSVSSGGIQASGQGSISANVSGYASSQLVTVDEYPDLINFYKVQVIGVGK
jgi:hypothetical protein